MYVVATIEKLVAWSHSSVVCGQFARVSATALYGTTLSTVF